MVELLGEKQRGTSGISNWRANSVMPEINLTQLRRTVVLDFILQLGAISRSTLQDEVIGRSFTYFLPVSHRVTQMERYCNFWNDTINIELDRSKYHWNLGEMSLKRRLYCPPRDRYIGVGGAWEGASSFARS